MLERFWRETAWAGFYARDENPNREAFEEVTWFCPPIVTNRAKGTFYVRSTFLILRDVNVIVTKMNNQLKNEILTTFKLNGLTVRL